MNMILSVHFQITMQTFPYNIHGIKHLVMCKWLSYTCKFGRHMKTVLSNYIMNRVSAKAERWTKYWVAHMTQDCRVKSPDTLCYEVQRYFCKLTVPRRKYSKCFRFRNCQSTSSQGCSYRNYSPSFIDCCSANLHRGPGQSQYSWTVGDKKKHRKPVGGPGELQAQGRLPGNEKTVNLSWWREVSFSDTIKSSLHGVG